MQSIKLASNNTVIYSKGAVVEEPTESITINSVITESGKTGTVYEINVTYSNLVIGTRYIDNMSSARGFAATSTEYTYTCSIVRGCPNSLPFTVTLMNNYLQTVATVTVTSTTPPYTS